MILQEKKQQINLNFELALNNSVIMIPTKHYVDRPKTKSAIALTKIILKLCTFSIKKPRFYKKKTIDYSEFRTRSK